ncbi:MAG: DUF4124 domain-containing protein [Burkholderiales bacterium]|nr:DUF4124 domain-containing protein [Burkholderiales bacterium]
MGYTALSQAASIYTWHDADGVQQFSDTCPPSEACEVKRIGGVQQPAPAKAQVRQQDTPANNLNAHNQSTATIANSHSSDATIGNSSKSSIAVGDVSYTGEAVAEGDGQSVGLVLAWNHLPESNTAGYRVYYAPVGESFQPVGQGVNVGKATSFVFTSVANGERYYFKVAAYDDSGHEHFFSNTVFKDVP